MARSFHVIKIIAHALFILFFLQIAKKKTCFKTMLSKTLKITNNYHF